MLNLKMNLVMNLKHLQEKAKDICISKNNYNYSIPIYEGLLNL